MASAARYLKLLIRLSGAGAMLLGLIMWSGHARAWLAVHIALGVLLVLAICGAVVQSWLVGARRGFAVLVLGWSLLVLVFGRLQVRLVPGPHHWIVALAHFLIGGIAIGLGAGLAAAAEKRLAGRAS